MCPKDENKHNKKQTHKKPSKARRKEKALMYS